VTNQEAITALSQSEKLKGGLIWVSSSLQMSDGLRGLEKRGAEESVKVFLNMVAHDVDLSKRVAPDPGWEEVQAHIGQALTMVSSGVGGEAVVHLTKALSRVTTIGQRAMTLLKENGLL
jgi:hypothetical protein